MRVSTYELVGWSSMLTTTGEVESRRRPPSGDEHGRPEKRRRGDDPILPATVCGGEPGFTRPSQQTPAAHSGSAQSVGASGQQIEYMPNLQPQWQSDIDFVRRQETAAQAACFRPLPSADTPMHANLTEAGETLVQQRAMDYPGSYDQNYFPANQGYGAVGAGATAWNDTSYNVQSEEFDAAFWNTIFP
jgi:hypothetical protein